MNSQFLANMPSTDGDGDVTEGLGRDQNLNNIEKQESPRRSSVATPVKSSILSNSQPKINTKDLFTSIETGDEIGDEIDDEIDDSYDPVTPSNSSAKAVRGNGRKTVGPLSPRKAASNKRASKRITKINPSSSKSLEEYDICHRYTSFARTEAIGVVLKLTFYRQERDQGKPRDLEKRNTRRVFRGR